nr:rhomboid family intramembrane serine protease [Mucilaginibacter rivuli]
MHYAPVASVIFAITIASSLLAFYSDDLYTRMILNPYNVYKGSEIYTLLTSGFIHKDWMHLAFNMMSFSCFAFRLEMILGHWQFGLLYIASLVLSDLPTVYKNRKNFWYRSLGASGAISAVVFGYIMFDPLAKLQIMFIPIGIPAILFGVLYLIYCVYASRRSADNINHDAHFYGAICGIVFTIILIPQSVHIFFGKLAQAFGA